ncbi:unnamed protein product [Arctogadus glacialis]
MFQKNRNPELRSRSSRHCSCESVPKSVPRLLLALLGNLIPLSVVVLPSGSRMSPVPMHRSQTIFYLASFLFFNIGTDEDTVTFVQWRVAHNDTFCGGRTTNKYTRSEEPSDWSKYRGGQTTAASWKWFELMHEAIGDRPSVTPPVLIATCAQGAVVFTAPSTSTPGGRQVEAAEETALGSLTPTTTGTSTASTPKRQRVDVVEVLNELKSQDEQEWRTMQAEEREREERREAEQVRQAAEREQREERRYRELCERQERCHQEAVAKEERWREEMRRDQEAAARDERRDREAAARDERRDREAAARDERFLAILERMAPK